MRSICLLGSAVYFCSIDLFFFSVIDVIHKLVRHKVLILRQITRVIIIISWTPG